jgi:transcriptional/translational regulatory protein YebC/TACO1
MELKENEISINEKPIRIKPVKLKFMKENFYSNYMTLRKLGTKIFAFGDSEEIVKGFLRAVMETEDVEEIYENIEILTLKRIIEITKTLNGIEDEIDIKNDQAMETEKE